MSSCARRFGVGVIAAGWLLALSPGFAQETRERVALFLSGRDCPDQREAIQHALLQTPGVLSVDASSVPDHLLIDRVGGSGNHDALAAIANAAMSTGHACHAEVMRSCITAEVPERHAPP